MPPRCRPKFQSDNFDMYIGDIGAVEGVDMVKPSREADRKWKRRRVLVTCIKFMI
jgi:hypothetical protein